MRHKLLLRSLFDTAVAAAQPAAAVGAHLPPRPKGETVVIGAGKASAQMAQALEASWDGPLRGLVVTRYGYAVPCERIEIVEAAHPIPDEAGLNATRRLFETIRDLGPDDLVIALISGGGSALLPCPAPGMSLADEVEVNRVLLASGAPIGVMNCIRKQLSGVKGGQLAAATRARVYTMVVSDIPGDVAAMVASGPTLPDETTRADALQAISDYRITLPAAAQAALQRAGALPLPQDPAFRRNSHVVIASAAISLQAAAEHARKFGFRPFILSDAMEGEARDVGLVHAALARGAGAGSPFNAPAVLLSGGETTVTLRGAGKGGRNSEFLLSFALAIDGVEGIEALAADTDGIDGSEANAGAYADGLSVQRMRRAGLEPRAMLSANDAYSAFEAVDDLLVTGPTGTNVNDFRAIVLSN
jgi:hydroxypyruvate reductase